MSLRALFAKQSHLLREDCFGLRPRNDGIKQKHASSNMRTTSVSRYHLNSPFSPAHSWLTNISLCYNGHSRDGLLDTLRVFLHQYLQATSALLPCGDFHLASPSLSGYQALTTPEQSGLYAPKIFASSRICPLSDSAPVVRRNEIWNAFLAFGVR